MNDGALSGRNPSGHDFVAGAIPYKIRLQTGDWTPYIVIGEKQWNYKADSMSCVSFSFTSVGAEVQEKFLTGVEKNYSDRWLAKMSGTTPQGNYLWKVADTARNIGLIPEADYPAPPEPWTWEQYHAGIPEPRLTELKMKAAEWRNKWDVAYEWVDITPESFSHHLKQAPLQLVIPGHAIGGLALKIENGIVTYLDSYEPWIKTAHISKFSDALKIVLTMKGNPMQFKTQKKGNELRIILQADSIETWKALCKVYGVNPDQIDEEI